MSFNYGSHSCSGPYRGGLHRAYSPVPQSSLSSYPKLLPSPRGLVFRRGFSLFLHRFRGTGIRDPFSPPGGHGGYRRFGPTFRNIDFRALLPQALRGVGATYGLPDGLYSSNQPSGLKVRNGSEISEPLPGNDSTLFPHLAPRVKAPGFISSHGLVHFLFGPKSSRA